MAPKAWIPNLVDGAPIWHDVAVLNAPELLAGRLLVPRRSKKDPSRMRWDVAGLVPLAEARERFTHEVDTALRDLSARIARAQAVLSDPKSPLHRLARAFSVPRVDDPRESRSVFYEPETKQLRIANWGAVRPPANYVYEGDDEEAPMSMAPAALGLDVPSAAETKSAPAAPMTKEQEAELVALSTQIEGDLADTREALDLLDRLLTQGELLTPE